MTNYEKPELKEEIITIESICEVSDETKDGTKTSLDAFLGTGV